MRTLILLGLAAGAAACGGAQVEIDNRSSSRLQDVTIAAGGSSSTVAAMAPATKKALSICPQGEAGALQLSFRVEDHVHRSEHPLYFECNSAYEIRVDISPGLEASAVVSLK